MLHLIFTLDYEIHGNGEGSPRELMVEPTQRLLRLFDEFGARLTIMADVAEIIRFQEYAKESGRDEFHYQEIARQLQHALRDGHDVQLHLHSSYTNAHCTAGRWVQDWSEYNFAGLPPARMDWMVRRGKDYLEELLRPVARDYRCLAFRAANWSVSPSQNVVDVLIKNQVQIDTSVFKFGRRSGLVNFDYSPAHHHLLPWRASAADICREDKSSLLWEFPIYCRERRVTAFATPVRLYRAWLGRRHRIADGPMAPKRATARPLHKRGHWIFQKHAWKADFNQCSGRQLINALLEAERHVVAGMDAPFVLIGHSKLFSQLNARSLRPLLAFVREHPTRFGFGTFGRFASAIVRERTAAEAHALLA